MRQRLARDRLKQSIVSGEIQVSELFETDSDLIEMCTKINKSYLIQFDLGFKLYMEGYWPEARNVLQGVS